MGKRNVSKRPNEWAARGFGGKQDNETPRITFHPNDQEPPTTSVNSEKSTEIEPPKTKKKQMSTNNVQPKRPLKILSKTKELTEAEETSFSEPSNNTSATKKEIGIPSEESKTKTPGKRKKSKQKSYTLFIGNLSYDTTREDIFAHFNKCGYIKEVRVPLSKEDNSSRGFAYLEVEDNVTYEVCI
jgi:RNA recognition motif-containing protein